MSQKNDKQQSWWQTLPGVMTSLGATITALTGLLLALNQAGIIGGQGQATPQPQKEKTAIPALTVAVSEPPATTPRAAIKPTATSEVIVPGAPSPTALSSSDTMQYPISLATGGEATAGEAVYRVMAAQIEQRGANQLALKMTLRMVNNGRFPVAFGSRWARLIIDGVPIAPEEADTVVVDAQSSKEVVFLFLLPENATTGDLQVGEVDHETSIIPMDLKAAQP